jgi:hypothetical protein
MFHIDRRAVLLNGEIDDVDSEIDSGTEASGTGEIHVHVLAA